MTMKNNAKFEKDLTCQFKLTSGIWRMFIRALKSLKNMHFNELFLIKHIMFELKKYRAVMFNSMVLMVDAKFEGKLTCAFKNDTKYLANFRSQAEKMSISF